MFPLLDRYGIANLLWLGIKLILSHSIPLIPLIVSISVVCISLYTFSSAMGSSNSPTVSVSDGSETEPATWDTHSENDINDDSEEWSSGDSPTTSVSDGEETKPATGAIHSEGGINDDSEETISNRIPETNIPEIVVSHAGETESATRATHFEIEISDDSEEMSSDEVIHLQPIQNDEVSSGQTAETVPSRLIGGDDETGVPASMLTIFNIGESVETTRPADLETIPELTESEASSSREDGSSIDSQTKFAISVASLTKVGQWSSTHQSLMPRTLNISNYKTQAPIPCIRHVEHGFRPLVPTFPFSQFGYLTQDRPQQAALALPSSS